VVIEAEAQVPTETAERFRIPGRPSALRRYEPYLIGGAAVAVVLLVWQSVAGARLVPSLFLPGPYDIASAEVEIFRSPDIWVDLATSGTELGAGFALAILAGLPIGLLMGWYRRLNHALDPFISFLYATPRVALLPLLIIWFGIGVYSKIAVIFLGAFFPIAINTMAGIKSLDSSLVKAARSFGASHARLFTTVALPGSVPFILTGLRLGVGHALVGVVVGELVAAQHGIGYEMMVAGSTWQTPRVFAYLILLAGTGVVLTLLLQRIERRFDAWRPRT
jgi:NitT/TauT family transport system permease protein